MEGKDQARESETPKGKSVSSMVEQVEERAGASQAPESKPQVAQASGRKRAVARKTNELTIGDKREEEEKDLRALQLQHERQMREIELAHEREMAEMRFEFERKSAIAKRSSRERVTSERSDSSEGEEEEEEGRREKVNVRKSSKILSRSQVQARKFMPKSLPSFDGKLENWPLFYNSYKDTTEACGYSHLENLQRLRECLKGDALEAVRSRLLEPESVPGVIEDLRCLFGRPERLLKSLLTKVRNTPPPDANKLATFITFGIAVKQLCDHLRAAQLEEHLNNPLLVDELVEKLPADYQMQWVRYKRYNCGRALGVFANFIDEIMTDASEVAKFEEKKDERHRTHKRQVQANVFAHSEMKDQSAKMKTCWMCKSEQHRVRDCDKFKSNAVSGRLELVSKLNLCKSCLNSHKGTCRFTKRCTFDNCNEEHHPLLHQQKAENANEGCNAHRDTRKETIFRVVAVTLRSGDITYDTTAFLDEGSSVTMLEDGVADKLQVKGDHEPFTISWTAEMTRREENSRKVNILLSATGSPEQFELRGIRTVSKLVIPKQELSLTKVKAQYEHLKDIPVNDKCSKVPRMLIGLDHLHLFAPIESRIGQPNEPIGVKTKLGWTIYGPKPEKKPQVEYIHFHTTGQISNEKLHDVIRDCYRIEESGISSARAVESDDDRRARDLLESTTTRIGERFKTGLLWKNDERNFPESFTMAKRRLAGLERKLMKDSQLERAVRKLIDEYITKEYAHKITKKELEETPASSVWYLPLNVVQNPRKPGKIRLVWDAAATVRGVSLNSELLKGPDMLCSLPSVIFPFRERRIGFGGDIKEMYHQIKISEEDKQAQRFLFTAGSGETDPQIFVMDVATFGATCSPCSAQYVKNLNAEQHREQYPEACAAIQLRHYVDDYFDSADTVDEALKLAKDVKYVHSRGGFLIRNWVSNAETFCTDMGEETAKSMIHLSDKSGENASDRVLGMIWEVKSDCFRFATPQIMKRDEHPTKRIVLACVMSIFDPIGLLSPLTILGKMLVQDLWRTGCTWDEDINDEEYKKWQLWKEQMNAIEDVKIPRSYFGNAVSRELAEIQLHVFADASENAYGCVAYFRVAIGNEVRCALVMSRTKVAPLKQLTIPRMELQAALLGARLANTVKNNHRYSIAKQYFWSDSQTVLSWIRSNQRKYKPFVAFRVGEILELSSVVDWKWVPTEENVADVLTKKISGCFEKESAWIKGPKFLYQPESDWPQQPKLSTDIKEELRATHLFHDVRLQESFEVVTRVSKWTVMVRVVACAIRFISNLKRRRAGYNIECIKPTKSMEKILDIVQENARTRIQKKDLKTDVKFIRVPLKQEEYQKAECFLLKIAQAEAYADELKVLVKNQDKPSDQWYALEKSSEIYRLTPLLDENGIMRMDGRTKAAETLPFDLRFPIILPRGHEVTRKIIQHYHEKNGHAFRETVKNELRQRFYIEHLNAEVRKVISVCAWCKVNKNRPTVPRMAPLPIERLSHHQRPFSCVGVDYFGPIEVVVGRSRQKRWIVLFTCLVVRAVHLEIAHDLSASACLMAIRRFVCRRGPPMEFISDNGTNLKAASKEIVQKIRDIEEECAEEVTSAHTSWRFIPPGTPHMGGAWERLVRTVKEALGVLVSGVRLTDEVLLTSVLEAEDLVNSRPLVYVADDTVDSLTPNHFLRGVSPNEPQLLPPVPYAAEALRDNYKRSQLLAEEMWQRWIKEYVTKLNDRTKWIDESKPLKVGDLVYVVDGKNRKLWVRGIVEDTIISNDGRCRQAWVKTKSGLFKRATSKLAVLEIGGNTCST